MMKVTRLIFGILAAVTLPLLSCTREIVEVTPPQESEGQSLHVSIGSDFTTKSALTNTGASQHIEHMYAYLFREDTPGDGNFKCFYAVDMDWTPVEGTGISDFSYRISRDAGLQAMGDRLIKVLVVAVDNHMERIEEIANKVSYAMKANVGDPEVIRSVGARNLDGVVVATADDMEASVMATLVSKELGVPYVLAKAKTELHAKVLQKIGADAVIFPEMEMGARVAKNLVAANFTDWITLSDDYSIIETMIPKSWVGRSLQDLDVRKNYGVNVVGTKLGEDVEVNPDPAKPLESGTVMILVGHNEDLERIK